MRQMPCGKSPAALRTPMLHDLTKHWYCKVLTIVRIKVL